MKILAIDTSCDETSAAILENNRVLSNVISSQVDLHKKWGGVVPDIARRAHKEQIDAVVMEALKRARVKLTDIDLFSATYGPGLAIALEVGLKKAQQLAIENKRPFAPVNHMEGHLLSPFATNSKGKHPSPPSNKMPMMGLLVSGGHTDLVLMKDFGQYKLLGETLDDAAGEAFDKVAKMLNLGYPGGPIISEFAKKGTPGRFDLPIPMEKSGDLNFSYSGLKTACLYRLEGVEKRKEEGPVVTRVYDFCADFVESIIKSLVLKLEDATSQYPVRGVLIGGGVMSNVALRRKIRSAMREKGIPVHQPYSPLLFTDNAAMIGTAAYFMHKRNATKIASGTQIDEIDRDPVAEMYA